jgi:Flp pilus assembly protein TadD
VEAVHKRLASWPGVDVDVWHSVEADVCEAEGSLGEAHWHLNRLLERQASAPGGLRLRREQKETDALVWHAHVSLANGDPEGYRRACANLLKHFDAQKEPGKATVVVRTLLLAPDVVTDLTAALKLLSANPQDAFTQTTRGGLLLRAGKLAEAVAELQKQPRDGVRELLLALALHKQGKPDEARRALDRARFVLDREASVRQAVALLGDTATGPWQAAATVAAAAQKEEPRRDWLTHLEIRLLRREAEALLPR